MKRHILIALSALLLAGVPGLRAEGEAKETDKAPRKERPERRREKAEDITPEEQAKRAKEAAIRREARIKELKAKQAAGTLSEGEKKQLERLELQAKRADRVGNQGNGVGKGRPAGLPGRPEKGEDGGKGKEKNKNKNADKPQRKGPKKDKGTSDES